jgi:hypothetical protein
MAAPTAVPHAGQKLAPSFIEEPHLAQNAIAACSSGLTLTASLKGCMSLSQSAVAIEFKLKERYPTADRESTQKTSTNVNVQEKKSAPHKPARRFPFRWNSWRTFGLNAPQTSP